MRKTRDGVPGMIPALKTADPVAGTHGTLSKFDLHNTLIASGPDFRSGSIDELPTSNLDVVPTVLHILGITPPWHLDGRVLYEAMMKNDAGIPSVESSTLEATREFPAGVWRQYLKTSKVSSLANSSVTCDCFKDYVDEGNGEMRPK